MKRLFNFLDSAIQESGNGSGESSAKEDFTATGEHSGFTGLTDKQLDKDDGPKQQGAMNSSKSAKQTTHEKSISNAQAIAHTAGRASLFGYDQKGSKSLSSSSTQGSQVVNQYTSATQQGLQPGYLIPQRTAGYRAFTGPYSTTTTTCKNEKPAPLLSILYL